MELKYGEQGMQFWGWWIARNGVMISREDGRVTMTPIGDPEDPDGYKYEGVEDDIAELLRTSG